MTTEQEVTAELRVALRQTDYNAGQHRLSNVPARQEMFSIRVGGQQAPVIAGVPRASGERARRLRYAGVPLGLEVYVAVSPAAWHALTLCVPGGLFVERSSKRRLAVSILTATPRCAGARPGDLVVAAGRQGVGSHISTVPALLRRNREGTWVRSRWLTWAELPDAAVAQYADALAPGVLADASAPTVLAATYGRAYCAALRAPWVEPHREAYRDALGEAARLRAKLQGFVHTLDELRNLRDLADTAIIEYARTDMGDVAGCTAVCACCPEGTSCPASAERVTRQSAVIDYERTKKLLEIEEQHVTVVRRRCIEAGCAPEELEVEHGRTGRA